MKRFLGGKLFVETRGTGVGLLEVRVTMSRSKGLDKFVYEILFIIKLSRFIIWLQ